MASVYANTELGRVPDGGGSVRVTIAANVGQGNGGTSLPCKMCWVVAGSGNSGSARVRIGTACTATTGEPVPKFGTNNYRLWIPIDDVSKIFLYSDDAADDVIDITFTT
jgi:hypothetical protein